jgi:Tfp pilus assembly protein PilN
MRPVNLIPPDERRGDSAPLRTGGLVYVLVGGLAALLLLVVVVALTGKQINDRKAEKASVEQELQQETARANSLQAFASFRAVQESRTATVTSLAESRFDWSRVLHELSLVLPSDVSIVALTGTVGPDVDISSSGGGSSGGGSDLRAAIEGPALEISGCAPGQDAVAGFVAALEDIDGVTRVGLQSSEIDTGSASSGSSGAQAIECNAGPDTAAFQITVAFDAVPTPPTATTTPSVPAGVPPTSSDQVSDAQETAAVGQAQDRATVSRAQSAVASGTGG